MLGEFELPNGDKKNELIDLTVENGKEYEGLKNKRVSIPCGALASGRNVIFTLQKVQHQNFTPSMILVKKQQLAKQVRCFSLLILLIKVGTKIA